MKELTWEEVRSRFHFTEEEKAAIALEEELIRTMIEIREKCGLTQAQMAEKCNMKQSMIARLEKSMHFPRVDTLLKVLVPMGYTLAIVPLEKKP